MVSINESGIVKAECISNFATNVFDTNGYIEPDGSVWIRIAHHNNPSTVLFSNSDSFNTQVYIDADRWFNVALCNLQSNTWELMIKQKTTSSATEEKYRWIQTANPMTAAYEDVALANVTRITDGYSTSGNYAGLYYNGDKTYLTCNNGNSSNWYGAFGCWTADNNGIPGYAGAIIKTGYLDLYLRIDNVLRTLASLYQNAIVGTNFIEI